MNKIINRKRNEKNILFNFYLHHFYSSILTKTERKRE